MKASPSEGMPSLVYHLRMAWSHPLCSATEMSPCAWRYGVEVDPRGRSSPRSDPALGMARFGRLHFSSSVCLLGERSQGRWARGCRRYVWPGGGHHRVMQVLDQAGRRFGGLAATASCRKPRWAVSFFLCVWVCVRLWVSWCFFCFVFSWFVALCILVSLSRGLWCGE